MNRFEVFKRLAWSILVVGTLAFAVSGCEGDDGRDGADGADGAPGAPGDPGDPGDPGAPGADGNDGVSCWDLNANGIGDLPDEDVNGDGAVDVDDCQPGSDPIASAIAEAQIESCATCHSGAGDGHQGVYNQYADPDTLVMEFTSLDVQPDGAGAFDLTLDFTITWNGVPYTGPLSGAGSDFASPQGSASFYVVEYDSGTGEFDNAGLPGFGNPLSAGNADSNGDGSYTLTQNIPVDPTAFTGGAIVSRLVTGPLDIEDDHYDPQGNGNRAQIFAHNASASIAIGDFAAFESAADVAACEACHGAPYRKHGTYPAEIADGNTPAFAMCRGCHNEASNGGHPEWQHEMDDPFAWATGQAPTAEQLARYGYERTLQQDVHMSHALHLPYPQSMANCATCHTGAKLAQVLDNDNFQGDTCQGCHVIEGIDASPAYGAQEEGEYYQPHRAPAFGYLWRRGFDLTFHENLAAGTDCRSCHGPIGEGPPVNAVGAPSLSDYHSGYDKYIYDAAGNRYATTYTATIDSIAYDDATDTITVEYHGSDAAVVPELLISFYGWDTKDFLVPSHWRDVSEGCFNSRSQTFGGCRFEFEPGDENPLFTADDTVAPPNYRTTANLSAFVAELTDDIPTLIDNMDVTKFEVTLTPYIDVGLDEDITLNAVTATYDLMAGGIVSNYFKGDGAITPYENCNACHDQLAVTFHSGSGRAGEITTCRNCHAGTNPGGHLEMQSRSIESYVHGIHSFQDFDTDDIFEAPFDPVRAKRYDAHINHFFPYFTALACEACHNPGTYNVPDQSKSMPGAISASYSVDTWYSIIPDGQPNEGGAIEDPSGRNIGSVPEHVVGPASKACGACHRADLINADKAGDLAAFNAHTGAFGTYVKNDTADSEGKPLDDEVLFGIIDKIMTLFE